MQRGWENFYRGINPLNFLDSSPFFRIMWRRLSEIDWNHHNSCLELSGKKDFQIIGANMLIELGETFLWSFGKEHLKYFSIFCFILLTPMEHSFLQKLIEAKLVSELSSFCKREFEKAFTWATHYTPSWAAWCRSHNIPCNFTYA